MNVPKQGEVWRHYKTKGEYEIQNLAKLQAKVSDLDMAECVVYKAHSDETYWVRPLADFMEMVKNEEGEEVARFSKVS